MCEPEAAGPGEISEALRVDDTLLYTATGCLAREGKLVFGGEGKRLTMSLAPQ